MTKAAWFKYGIYAASVVCGICASIFPVAAPILIPVATGLAGLATRTPGSNAVPSETEDPVTANIKAKK